jgi:hypothetical protein
MTPLPLRLLAQLRGHDLPLAGDLMEEYGRGRSLMWLWSQVIVALALGACEDLQRHPLSGVRATAVLALGIPAVMSLFANLRGPIGVIEWQSSGPVVQGGDIPLASLLVVWVFGFARSVFYGWAAVRLSGRFRVPVVVCMAIAGTFHVAQSAWSVQQVLWMYPWNSASTLARAAALSASFGIVFLVGLWLGAFSPLPKTPDNRPMAEVSR